MATAYNSVFAVRFTHQNACGTSQTRKPLCGSGGVPPRLCENIIFYSFKKYYAGSIRKKYKVA